MAGAYGLVGSTCNNSSGYNTGSTVTMANAYDGFVSTGLSATLPMGLNVQKWYFQNAGPTAVPSGMTALANLGCQFRFCVKPSQSLTTADKNQLGASVTAFLAAGLVGRWVLWQEPNQAPVKSGFANAAAYHAYFNFYAPAVTAAGGTICYDPTLDAPGDYGDTTTAVSYYPGDTRVSEILCDYYAGAQVKGTTLDAVAALADGHSPSPIPFGIGEWGGSAASKVPTLADWTAYTNYLISFFQARVAAGKTNAPIIYFNDVSSIAQPENFIASGTDFKIPGIQNVFANLSPSSNVVTVTNPGAQASGVGTLAGLHMAATDSQVGQTFTWSATKLPGGLSINAGTGVIGGTTTTKGTFSPVVTATDTTGAFGTATFTWTVSANTVTVTNPGSQSTAVGASASLQMTATDSQTGQTLTWSATGLPDGLTIGAATGLIAGNPTTAGSATVKVTATDASASSGSATFTWTVTAVTALQVTTRSLPSGVVGAAFGATVAATGGTLPYTWSLNSGALPTGLSLSVAGNITGTPSAAGTFAFTPKVTDHVGATATTPLVISIASGPPTPVPPHGGEAPVNGPAPAVLTAVLRASLAHPGYPYPPGVAYFSQTGPPLLPSMVYDEVFMPGFALLDATVQATGSVGTSTAGVGVTIAEGANAKQGTVTLAGTTTVVTNTSVTASSRILLTSQADGGTPGWLRVSSRVAGTSFTITSSSGSDASTVAYFISEPSS